MDPLDFLTDEDLLRFFHCKKTEISCIEQPHTFLNQLRDHNLVPEDIYKKVLRMKSKQKGVYQVLDWLERERPHCIKLFWSCVFKDHILQQYPALRLLRNSMLDGSFSFFENLPEKEDTPQNKKEEDKEKKGKKPSMPKKRKRSVEEEEEEPGPSSPFPLSQKKKPPKPSFSSPLKRGEKGDIWKWPFYKCQIPVTCGKKKGSLHRDKLASGEECILAGGRWFSPQDFEEFGGRKSWKNWKISIRCQDTPLKKLIEEGHLKSPPFNSRQSAATQHEQRKRKLFPSSRSTSSISVSDTDSEENENKEDREEEDEEEEEEEEENCEKENEEGHDNVEMSAFGGPCLAVTCGSAKGTLQKDRFASGTLGRCIRTADKWLTPADFVKEDPKFANSFWKKSIMCQGEPLSFLIEREILQPHSLLCKCRLCSGRERDLLEQENDDDCSVCGSPGSLVCCDQCPRAFHPDCHLPPVVEDMLGDNWLCTYCVLTEIQRCKYACTRTRKQALDSRVLDFMLECQYLLLHLYNSDKQNVFAANPCLSVVGYRNFIKSPMWLEKVADNLQNGHYSTMRQFVSDIHLIFDNCAKFNKGNEFGEMGARLRQLFETEFESIFSIQQ